MAVTTNVVTVETVSLRGHLMGCPGVRIESYDEVRPGSKDSPPMRLSMARCIDCGAYEVADAQPIVRQYDVLRANQ